MTEIISKKIDRLEGILLKIDAKIDNFLGFADLSAEESKEVKILRKDIKSGKYVKFNDVFCDQMHTYKCMKV